MKIGWPEEKSSGCFIFMHVIINFEPNQTDLIMKRILCFVSALLLAACAGNPKTIQNTVDGKLPRATAKEQAAFAAAGMQAFYDAVDELPEMELHSAMVLHHGRVVAEKWWEGNGADSLHVMHSVSKSFTAAAVGFAVNEGLFALDDKVVSFFPDKAPEENPLMMEMTVRDLLTMSTGQMEQSSRSVDDWIADFMNNPVVDKPGTVFRYNSLATFMLSAIVQNTSGQKLLDYLQPRLFGPLEIEGIRWDENPQGINTGGWGLYVRAEDMAKFGQLFLQKGVWNGKQLLPQGWVEEASSWKISNGDPAQDSDWTQGYCYQMWRCRHNAYRADGAWGQFIVVIPDEDAVVVITAHARDMQAELDLVWRYILPVLGQPAKGN